MIDSLLGAGVSLLGNFLTGENKYERDRNDANRDWDRQNEYNSPKNQMARFKEAGLNPNLIYGQGTPGNASATPVSMQKSGAPEHKADLQQIYGDAKRLEANMQQTQQTVENLKTNQELMKTNMELNRMLMPHKISSLDSQTQWRKGLLEPTIGAMNLRQAEANYKMDIGRQTLDLARDKYQQQERLNKSAISYNDARQEVALKQKALIVQQTAKQFEETLKLKDFNKWSPYYATLQKIYAETDAITQGRQTSMSVESLNKANQAMKDYQLGLMPFDKLMNVLTLVTKNR